MERNPPPQKPIMGYFNNQPSFPLGKILVSPGVINLGIDPRPLLRRHQACDWQHLCEEDIEANHYALKHGEAILTRYHVTTLTGEVGIVAIMTEEDRSFTVVFMEGEPGIHPAG
jgi:hypothetical protein